MNTVSHKLDDVIKHKIQPLLQEHGGGVEIVDYKDFVLSIKLLGSCVTCPHLNSTFEDVVKKTIYDNVPEIKEIYLIQGVSNDLLEIARNILNKNIKLD